MTRPQDILDTVETVLNNNISDPNTRRSGPWIHQDFPRLDATMPRIGIIKIGGVMENRGIGSNQRTQILTIQCSILNKKGSNGAWDVEGDSTLERGEDVLDWIADQCVQAIQSNQSSFKTAGADCIYAVNEVRTPPPENSDVVQHNVDFEARIPRND